MPDFGMVEASDHALDLILLPVLKLPFITEMNRRGVWDYRHTVPVRRIDMLTVGVVGVGRIRTKTGFRRTSW